MITMITTKVRVTTTTNNYNKVTITIETNDYNGVTVTVPVATIITIIGIMTTNIITITGILYNDYNPPHS